MGLFLQKTNIIRDYLEDMQEGRAFWPEEVSLSSGNASFICISFLNCTTLLVWSRQKKYSCTHVCLNIYPRFISRTWLRRKHLLFEAHGSIVLCVSVQAWSQFAGRLEDFAQPEKLDSALSCLNLLVTDALRHVPDVIAYLSRLRNQSVFNFCAIPQVLTDVPPECSRKDVICGPFSWVARNRYSRF